MKYKSLFREESKLIDPQSIENEIQLLSSQLSRFQKELEATKTPELRDEIKQKIYYTQQHIYDLEDELDDLRGGK